MGPGEWLLQIFLGREKIRAKHQRPNVGNTQCMVRRREEPARQVQQQEREQRSCSEMSHSGTWASLGGSLVSINHTAVVYVGLHVCEWKIRQKMLFGGFPSILFPWSLFKSLVSQFRLPLRRHGLGNKSVEEASSCSFALIQK